RHLLPLRRPRPLPTINPDEPDKRNVDELERQIRRLVDRALRDVREDFDEFFSDKKDCPCATHNPLASPVERRDALYQSVRFEDFLSITRQSSRRS
ncbi:MAG: hypothetical protein ACI92S_002712, partial [Planctomycetaceae bacterium]